MEQKKKMNKTKISLAIAASLIAASSAMGGTAQSAKSNKTSKSTKTIGLVAPQANGLEAKNLSAKADIPTAVNERMSLIQSGLPVRASYMPNMPEVMKRIAPYCSKAVEILSKARQKSADQFVTAPINQPQALLAAGNTLATALTEASNELSHGSSVGINELHFAIAVNQAAEVSKTFVDVVQQNMAADSTALVGRISYAFHSRLVNLTEFASVQLDRQYLIPYYQTCGVSPIIVLPPTPTPQPPPPPPGFHVTPAHPVNPYGAPLAQGAYATPLHGQHYGQWPAPGHGFSPIPGWGNNCGLQIVYVNRVKELAVQFLELANEENNWTGFANDVVQLTVLKSLSSAARTTLVMSEIYNPYYVQIIHALYNLEVRISEALQHVGQGTQASEHIKRHILSQYSFLNKALKQVSDYQPQFIIQR